MRARTASNGVVYALLVAAMSMAGCARDAEAVRCGGEVHTKAAHAEIAAVLTHVRADTRDFCSAQGGDCDLTLVRVEEGWAVAARRAAVQKGQCVWLLGEQKYFVYDVERNLSRAIEL